MGLIRSRLNQLHTTDPRLTLLSIASAGLLVVAFVFSLNLLPSTNERNRQLSGRPNSFAAGNNVNADFNTDSKVDVFDLGILASHFGIDVVATSDAITRACDINSDGKINVFDLGLMMGHYGKNITDSQTPTPTNGSSNPTPTVQTGGITPGANSVTLAHAYGLWTPSSRDTCSKDVHDSYFVVGPDGKKYPTWHPPTGPNGCSFGHEHGRDPSGYQFWDEIKQHFAYDADKNGSIGTDELKTAGLPFGYVNEQIDQQGHGFMRHEDHVGHKVEYANGEGDLGDAKEDAFSTSTTGGVVVPIKTNTGGAKWAASGVSCYHLHKIHQGVSTPDALTNNLHELIMHTKCTSTRSDFPASTSIISGMVQFGAPGEFNPFCNDTDRTLITKLGTTDANKSFPGSSNQGSRQIISRECVERTVLVPQGQFSSFPYEIWDGGLQIKNTNGQIIAENGGSWEVLDAIRYYNPASANKISYTASWCYETLGDRKARGGSCDDMTNYGQITGITFDDPRSAYRGLHRGQYVNAHRLHNAGGSQYYYTDSFGNKAQTTPFAGSIKQMISTVNADLVGKINFDPRITQRRHNSGNNSVHAPN